MKRTKYQSPRRYRPKKRRLFDFRGCLSLTLIGLAIFLGIGLIISAYLFFPNRTNILLLGLDYTDPWNAVGRTDTIILSTFVMPDSYVGLLSIPRDLWITVPGYGENRINTAHYFAEAKQANTGPALAIETIEQNFGVDVDYFMRIRFDGFREVINAMGGLDIYLTEPMAGYAAGYHHLTGNKALAFARHRIGSDDFFRMARGQFLIKSIIEQMIKPVNWIRFPAVFQASVRSIDTDIPAWMWPRLLFIVLFRGPNNIDNQTITREMTVPTITNSGANVLIPRWELINPVLYSIFGQ